MDREKAINELMEHIESALAVDSDYVDCVRTDLLQTVVGLLKEQPEIVRCISCTFYRSDGECTLHNGRWKPEGFCSWAIRKEGR